jgi:hypothetical protein
VYPKEYNRRYVIQVAFSISVRVRFSEWLQGVQKDDAKKECGGEYFSAKGCCIGV